MIERALHPFELFAASYLATVIVASGCAFLGVFVALKRIVFVGAALAEVSAAGIAVALSLASAWGLGHHETSMAATAGAIVFSLAGVAILGIPAIEGRITREGFVAIGFALGASAAILVVWKSAADLEHVKNILSGSSLYVTDAQLMLLAAAFLTIGALHAGLHKELVFVSFDPLMASTLGVPARAIDLVLYGTIGLAIAISLPLVGVLPVFGFLTIPALSGLLLGDSLRGAFTHAAAHAIVGAALGLTAADAIDLPLGPATVAVLLLMLIPSAIVSRLPVLRKAFLAAEVVAVVVALSLAGLSLHHVLRERAVRARHAGDALALQVDPHAATDAGAAAKAAAKAAAEAGGDSHQEHIRRAMTRIEAGDPRGVAELVLELASDAPPFDRGEVLDTLRPIAGEDFGYDSDRDAAANAEAIRRWNEWVEREQRKLIFDPRAKTFRVGGK